MAQPGELVSRCGDALMRGQLDAMAGAFNYPYVISLHGTQHVVRTPEQTVDLLEAFREYLLIRGIASARTEVASHVIVSDDLAFLTAATFYADRQGNQVTESRCSYVLRLNVARWEIITLSIDQKAKHSHGACLLEDEAA